MEPRRVLGLSLLCCIGLLLVGAAGSAAAAPADLAEGNETTTADAEWTVVNVDTGEVEEFAGDRDISDLPLSPGEYVAEKTVLEDGETSEVRTRFQVESDGTVSGVSTTHETLENHLSVRVDRDQGGYATTEDVTIFVGAYNETRLETLSDLEVTVDIRYPNGTTESFSLRTDASGRAQMTFDLSGLPEGEYSVNVHSDSIQDEGWTDFIVGEYTQTIPRYTVSAEAGESVSMAIRKTEGASPVSGSDQVVEVRNDANNVVFSDTITTGTDGIAQFSFTPSSPGEYRLDLPDAAGDTYARFEVGAATGDFRVNGDQYGTDVLPGQTVYIDGLVTQDGTAYANQEVQVVIINESADDEPVYQSLNVTTNDQGQFVVPWTPPEQTGVTYRVEFRTSSGEPIAGADFLDVEIEGTTTETGGASMRIETDQFNYQPGETVTATLTVTDADGNPVANTEVSTLVVFGYDDLPFFQTTVTTNSSGMATVEFQVPSDLPGQIDYGYIRAATTVDGEDVRTDEYVSFSPYEVDEQLSIEDREVQPGESFSVTYTVTDSSTGEAVSDLPLWFQGTTEGFGRSLVAADTGRTDTAGQATFDVTVPSDARGVITLEAESPRASLFGWEQVQVDSHGTTLSGPSESEYAPGETVTFDYSVSTSSSVNAVVTVSTWENQRVEEPVLFADIVAPGEQVSVTIPSTAPDDVYFRVQVRTLGADGSTGFAEEWFRVESSGTSTNDAPTASFSYSPSEPTAGETVTFNASASGDSDGNVTDYVWDFDGDGTVDATGEVVTHTFESAGSYSVSLAVTDDDGAQDSATRTVDVQTAPDHVLRPASTTLNLSAGGTMTVPIVLTNVDAGVGAFDNITVSVGDTSVATVTDVSTNVSAGASTWVADDGSSGTARVAFGGDTPDSGTVTVMTVTVEGVADGSTSLSVRMAGDVADENGFVYRNISARGASVSVRAGPSSLPGFESPPTNVDGDAQFEDVNGNSRFDIGDVQALFANRNTDAVQNNVDAFDFNNNGRVDIGDIQSLFVEYVNN